MHDLWRCEVCLCSIHLALSFLFFSFLYALVSFLIAAPHNLLNHVIRSLLDILGGEVQVSVVDPLNLEPVLEVVVSTATKLHLQTIDGLFLKAAARDVCVLVEANTIPQAHLTVEREAGVLCYLMLTSGKTGKMDLNVLTFPSFDGKCKQG